MTLHASRRPDLSGSLVLVTGASSGVGEATAVRVAGLGASVILIARREAELERVAGQIRDTGGMAHVLAGDLRDAVVADALLAQVLAIGVPDVVVAAAGHSIARPVLASARAGRAHDYERTVAINYLGAVRVFLACLPGMAARGSGHLIALSTVNARIPTPGWAPYAASKAALDAWMSAAGPELSGLGIACTTIDLPLVATPMSVPTYGTKPCFALQPEDAAALVERAIRDRPSRLAPGWARLAAVIASAAPRLTGRVMLAASRQAARLRRD